MAAGFGLLLDNTYQYQRLRTRFGRECNFTDLTQLMLSCAPSARQRLNYILRCPITRDTQLSVQLAFTDMNTDKVYFTETGLFHYEGGWPKELNMHDEEQTTRHRKKIERDDFWGPQVNELVGDLINVAYQNNTCNIYEGFFGHHDLLHEIRHEFTARGYTIFHDCLLPTRKISTVHWAPQTFGHVMSQHTDVYTDEVLPYEKPKEPPEYGSPNCFFVWDVKHSVKPVSVLDAIEPITRAQFCPKDENFAAAGTCTGKVCVWDTLEGGMPLQMCELEVAHRQPVSALIWVHSKTNSEFYSGSWDGDIKYWDARSLRKSTFHLYLDPTDDGDQFLDRAHGVSVMEFEYTIPVRFMIGSIHGTMFLGNRKATVANEILTAHFRLFNGPMRTIERNPFFVKNFIVTGDWVAKVWAEECKGFPTTLLIKKKDQVSCAAWSRGRCSLFATGTYKGEVDFWDLLMDQRTPVVSYKFKCSVNHMQFRSDGRFLAVGLQSGDCFVLEVSKFMHHMGHKDKYFMAALFEREILRAKFLDGRVEEVKLKRKLAKEREERLAREEEEREELPALDPENPKQFLQLIERDTEFKEVLGNFAEVTEKLQHKRSLQTHIWEQTDFELQYEIEQQEIADAAAAAARALEEEKALKAAAAEAARLRAQAKAAKAKEDKKKKK